MPGETHSCYSSAGSGVSTWNVESLQREADRQEEERQGQERQRKSQSTESGTERKKGPMCIKPQTPLTKFQFRLALTPCHLGHET